MFNVQYSSIFHALFYKNKRYARHFKLELMLEFESSRSRGVDLNKLFSQETANGMPQYILCSIIFKYKIIFVQMKAQAQ
jgi:hypothetical protein